MSFIFDEINMETGHALKYKGYWYYFVLLHLFKDTFEPEITFKTKYNLESISRGLGVCKFKSRKYVYVIDEYGNIPIKTTEDKLEQILKEKHLIIEHIYDFEKEVLSFDKTKYEYVAPPYDYSNKKIYEVIQNNKYALIDEQENIIIPFGKYKVLSLFSFSLEEKIYIIAQSAQNDLWGIIDIDENVVIPFMYDEIHDWNIEPGEKTIQVKKNNKVALIDINNNILLDFKYKYIFGFIEGEYSFAEDENGKWGVINRNGEEINFDLDNVKELKLKVSGKRVIRKEYYGRYF